MLLKQGLAYSLFYIENIQLHPMRKWKLKIVYVISICTVSVLFLLLLLLLFFFYLLELYCLFFIQNMSDKWRGKTSLPSLRSLIIKRFFFFFRVLALFNIVFIRKMWCNRSDCAFHDVYFFYIPRFINCRSFVTV